MKGSDWDCDGSVQPAGGDGFTDPSRARVQPCWMLCTYTGTSLHSVGNQCGSQSSPPVALLARLCLSPAIPKPLWEEEGAGIFLLCARYPLWTQGVEKSEQLNAEERREFGVRREEWGKSVQGLGRHNRAGHRIQLLTMQKGRGRQIQEDSCPQPPHLWKQHCRMAPTSQKHFQGVAFLQCQPHQKGLRRGWDNPQGLPRYSGRNGRCWGSEGPRQDRTGQDRRTLVPMMERTSSSGEVGVPEMSGLLLLRLRERFRLRLAGRTAERAMVA